MRDAFATPTNRRFSAFWTKGEDAFAQAWDYPTARALWANPPFSRLDEVVTKARVVRAGVPSCQARPQPRRP